MALDGLLRQLATGDANVEDSKALLLRLQKIADGGGVPTNGAATNTSIDTGEQHAQCRRIIDRTVLLLERLEVSTVEHRVNHQQLLETMVLQRGHLVAPRSLVRDHKAHNSVPVHCCSPHGVRFPQVEHKLEMVADAGAWLLCKDPFFLNGHFFYVNKTTRTVQTGEPFDFLMKKARQNLCQEKW